MNKETKITLTIIIMILVFISIKFGQYFERETIMNACSEKNGLVFDNKYILRCQVVDIDLILKTNYWEREE